MPGERTPLLQNVPVAQPRQRYPHDVFRRFCTIAISSSLIAFTITVLFGLIFDAEQPGHRPPTRPWPWPGCGRGKVSFKELQKILLDTPSSENAAKWSEYYTSGPHLAGQNYSQATWTRDRWEEWGIKSDIVPYEVYLNRHVDHRLALLEKSSSKDAYSWNVAYEATLKEDVLKKDPTTGLDERIPTFHGYSASGNVTAPVVYVNYGTYQDFAELTRAGVALQGKIAIARYGGVFRGLKVKRAQELGMVGVLLYSDPGDDGEVTGENGVKSYPIGPARNPSSVQRGSVEFLSMAPGDPTTPGYPSKPGVPRAPVDKSTPSIPSLPISYADALPILKALNGHGPTAKDFNKYWTANTGLRYLGVNYNIGPTPDIISVNLYNEQKYMTTPNWDVIGIINGTVPDEVVVVGNHRDAWIVGGAVDPNSGSAALNEVVRSFGVALSRGWRPRRTIVFASWDGEEYSLLGSTEWVEEYLPWLTKANVAYVNVDTGVSGPHFGASAAPLLNQLIYDVTAAVPSPNQTVKGQTVRDTWDGHITTMGSGSDFTAFQDHAGIPSMDIKFHGGPRDAVFQYHSNYDSFYWMSHFGDPGFVYHRTMSQILGLITAKLADEPLIPFRAGDYAAALKAYVDKVGEKLDMSASLQTEDAEFDRLSEDQRIEVRASQAGAASLAGAGSKTFDREALKHELKRLYHGVAELDKRASKLDAHADELRKQATFDVAMGHDGSWWPPFCKARKLWRDIRRVNDKYKRLEREFLYEGGLDERAWFKHVVFAPGRWTGYSGAVFPGLVESIEDRDYENALKWVGVIEGCISRARKSL